MNQNITIFYAEDDIDDQETFQEVLEIVLPHAKLHVHVSGDQLIFELKKQLIRPDLIFLDLNMPGKSGFFTLYEIKESDDFKDIPVIILSTTSDMAAVRKARSMGANMFVTKPHIYNDFKELMKLLLAIDWQIIPPATKTFFVNVNF